MQEISYLDRDGQKRRGYEKQCKYCKKTYLVRKSRFQESKFCSALCRNKGNEKSRTNLVCPICGKTFTRLNSTLRGKSKIYFCSRSCKDKAASLAGGIKDIWPDFYGTGDGAYRKLFTEEELKCDRCGYDEFSEVVEIHHKDGNHGNSNKENLQPLCPTCHRAKHKGLW